jgi:metal-responsive CopG/Arc/MetJ family transcriptional regulator
MDNSPAYSKQGETPLTSRRKRGWKTIQLPEELLNRVDELVERPELGYTSRSELIKEAVRLRAEALEAQIREKERKS